MNMIVCCNNAVIYFVQALNTLGSTKWRVNKRVLGIIDRIWASGGRLADLVDCEDVGCIICITR